MICSYDYEIIGIYKSLTYQLLIDILVKVILKIRCYVKVKNMKYIFNETIGWLIYKARYLTKNRLQRKLKDYDISTEQWSILSMIYLKEGCNQKELAESLLKDRAALTRILDILEKKDLVKREHSPNDRREFLVYITENGRTVYNEALKVVAKNSQEINDIFSEDELEQLKKLLKKLISNL